MSVSNPTLVIVSDAYLAKVTPPSQAYNVFFIGNADWSYLPTYIAPSVTPRDKRGVAELISKQISIYLSLCIAGCSYFTEH